MEFTCPACSKQLRVSDEHAGKTIRCPHCKQPAKAPSVVATPEPKSANTVQCPGCHVSIRRPTTTQASAIRCPKCQSVIPLKAVGAPSAGPKRTASTSSSIAPVSNSAAPRRTPAPQAKRPQTQAPSASSFAASDPFSSASPYASPLSSSAPPLSSAPSLAATPRGGKSKAIGPAICLLIQGLAAVVTNFVATVMVVVHDPSGDPNLTQGQINAVNSVRILWSLWCFFGLVYQGVIIAGAVAMFQGRSTFLAKTAAIMAIIPITGFTFGFCSGVVLYFLALAGGIWGLTALSSSSKSTSFAPAGGGYASSGNFAPKPSAPAWGAAAKTTNNASDDIGPMKGVAFIIGGIACLGVAGFLGYSLYNYFVLESSEYQMRRPTKAIGGAVTMLFLGFSLIATGAMALMKKK